jgi:hypothetical protein
MRRDPTEEEQQKIASAIFLGDRVEATNIYISVTECGLTEAQQYVRALTEHLKATEPGGFKEKRFKKHWLK